MELKKELAKVDVMTAALKVLGIGFRDKCKELELDPKASKADKLIAVLQNHFALSEKQNYRCNVCNGNSTDEVEVCPFCGSGGIEGAAAAGAELPDDVAAAPEQSVAALATAAEAGVMLHTLEDLERSVSDIIAKRDATASCMYELGIALQDNFDKQLWRLRKDDNGKPLYADVKEFWEGEIGFSKSYCYGLMDVCRNFSREDVQQIGAAKLRAVLRAPEGKEREKLLGMARNGVPQHEIEDAIKQRRADAARKTDVPAQREQEARTKGPRFTVARRPERSEHYLYAETPDPNGNPRRATTIADQPSTVVRISDELVVCFRLTQELTGEIVLIEEWRKEALGSKLGEQIKERKAAKKKGAKKTAEKADKPADKPADKGSKKAGKKKGSKKSASEIQAVPGAMRQEY